jgi:hypothetical protein
MPIVERSSTHAEPRLVDLLRAFERDLLSVGLNPRDYCLGCRDDAAWRAVHSHLGPELRPISLADLTSKDGSELAVGRMGVRKLGSPAR